MNPKMRMILAGALMAVILTACQVANAATPTFSPASGQPSQGSQPPSSSPASSAAYPTAAATAVPTTAPTAAPTAVSPTAAAVQAAQDYFATLQKGDFAAASRLVSAFSLTASKLTAADVVEALTVKQQAGAAYSTLQVLGSEVFNSNTVLVHVSYTLSTRDAKTGQMVTSTVDEQWPFRLEQKKWLYNWTNIIDFKTLSSETKLSNGLAITPLQLTRYSDKIELTVLAQNSLNEAVVIGQTNQTLAVFHFGSQSVNAVNTRYVFDTHRSYTDVTIDVSGLFTSYPDSVEIVKYVNYQTAPWFTFALTD